MAEELTLTTEVLDEFSDPRGPVYPDEIVEEEVA